MSPTEPGTIAEPHGEISQAIVDQASEWLVKLWSGVATAADHDACLRWRDAHADHERAWQRLEGAVEKFHSVPRDISKVALEKHLKAPSRRRVLKTFGALLAGSTAIYAGRRTEVWQRYAADFHTAIGETRAVLLADSSRIVLNTATAIDVRFDARERRVELRAGEILVETAHDAAERARPFIVTTPVGNIRALGTRFTVRQTDEGLSKVAVFEGAVAVEHGESGTAVTRIEAGRQAILSRRGATDVAATDESASAWTSGSLIVERMRLDAFLQELNRYRAGVVRCDPSVAHLVLTGVYSLDDTDRILRSLAKALPVTVDYRTRYWVVVTAR